jgi:hypothetical protein
MPLPNITGEELWDDVTLTKQNKEMLVTILNALQGMKKESDTFMGCTCALLNKHLDPATWLRSLFLAKSKDKIGAEDGRLHPMISRFSILIRARPIKKA